MCPSNGNCEHPECSAVQQFLSAKNFAERGWQPWTHRLASKLVPKRKKHLVNQWSMAFTRNNAKHMVRLRMHSKNINIGQHGVNRRRLRPWTVCELVTTCTSPNSPKVTSPYTRMVTTPYLCGRFQDQELQQPYVEVHQSYVYAA